MGEDKVQIWRSLRFPRVEDQLNKGKLAKRTLRWVTERECGYMERLDKRSSQEK